LRIETLGAIDELNASLGAALLHVSNDAMKRTLHEVQCRLFDLGAAIAGDEGVLIAGSDISALERSIDTMSEELPPLKAFILPTGCEAAVALHSARTVARRAERALVHLSESEPTPSMGIAYLNRLSDWLFTAARTSNALADVLDVEWHPRNAKE